MATKLALFNAALLEVGHTTLTDTGEAVEAGRVLNEVYSQVVDECLAVGSWNFAMETIKAEADTGVTPEFGFTEVFAKPTDWVRTIGISQDEYFAYPLLHYYDDANFWSADVSPIYVRYVSDDTGLGYELTRWPAAFARYVGLELADRICLRVTQNLSLREEIAAKRDKARTRALNHDAMNEPQPKFAPPGSWTTARWGRSGGDRGNRGSLIG
jgi:hypothetical protein